MDLFTFSIRTLDKQNLIIVRSSIQFIFACKSVHFPTRILINRKKLLFLIVFLYKVYNIFIILILIGFDYRVYFINLYIYV
jgi:hypothetical protein